jgi:hypothetical protein
MHRIVLFFCSLLLVPLICYGQAGSPLHAPVSNLAATSAAPAGAMTPDVPIACSPTGQPLSQEVDGINIYLFCGVTGHQRKLISDYVHYALDTNPPGTVLKADIYVLHDLQQAAGTRFRWLIAHGYPQGYQHILEALGADCAEAEKGALFFYLTEKCWSDGSDYPNEELILHEMHHLLQLQLAGGLRGDLPAWLEEGGADFFAWQGLDAVEGAHVQMTAPSPACNYRLSDLEARDDPSRALCAYWEGQHAVAWLISVYGADLYYRLFELEASGHTFEDIFLTTYGISTPSFYRLFDQYRKSDYKTMPTLPARPDSGMP